MKGLQYETLSNNNVILLYHPNPDTVKLHSFFIYDAKSTLESLPAIITLVQALMSCILVVSHASDITI
jgi:hypothetical protein